MIGIGLDILDLIGEVPFALGMCVPAAFVLYRFVSPWTVVHRGALALIARPG
jgi:hypothetical protein